MIIELEIKEISVDKVHDKGSYQKEGLYLVNDGIAWLLISASKDNIYSMPLQNKDIVMQFENKAKTRCMEDIKGVLEGKLNYIIELVKRQEDKPIAIHHTSAELDIDKITKLVQSVNAPFMNTVNKAR